MRRRSSLVLGLALACLGRTASANQPAYAYDLSEVHERWSWVPLVSARAGSAPQGAETVSVLGAYLHLRYGKTLQGDSHHTGAPKLLVVGVGVQTTRLDSIEPLATVGIEYLPGSCYCWDSPIWLDLRADLSLGYRWQDRDAAPFVSAKVGIGALFSRSVLYTDWARGEPGTREKARFRSEVALVVDTQLARGGEWLVTGGLELDPFRLIQDIAAVFP